jgi:hypothetical protein
VEIEGYRILSDSGSLDAAGWNSLEDQSIGEWHEANPNSHQVAELEQAGILVLEADNSYELGAAFSPAGSQDLVLEFLLAG